MFVKKNFNKIAHHLYYISNKDIYASKIQSY